MADSQPQSTNQDLCNGWIELDSHSALTFLKLRKQSQSFLMVLPASGSGELLIRSMQSTNVSYTTVRHIHLKIEIYQIKSLCC